MLYINTFTSSKGELGGKKQCYITQDIEAWLCKVERTSPRKLKARNASMMHSERRKPTGMGLTGKDSEVRA